MLVESKTISQFRYDTKTKNGEHVDEYRCFGQIPEMFNDIVIKKVHLENDDQGFEEEDQQEEVFDQFYFFDHNNRI